MPGREARVPNKALKLTRLSGCLDKYQVSRSAHCRKGTTSVLQKQFRRIGLVRHHPFG